MNFKTQIKVISQSKSGREIELKDTTGLQSNGVPTGYGPDNVLQSDVLAYHITLCRLKSSIVYKASFGADSKPTIMQMTSGFPFKLRSSMFEKDLEGEKAFLDGVIDLNSYIEVLGYSNLVINKGDNFITGTIFSNAEYADAVIIEGKIYQVDKSKYTNGGTIIYLTSAIQDDSTYFNILYQANTKSLLQEVSNNQYAYAISKVYDQSLENQKMFIDDILRAFHYKNAANYFMNCRDYSKADELVNAANKLLYKFT